MGWTWSDWSLIFRTYLPSVRWHCWLGHLTRKTGPDLTYNVFGWTLNLALSIYPSSSVWAAVVLYTLFVRCQPNRRHCSLCTSVISELVNERFVWCWHEAAINTTRRTLDNVNTKHRRVHYGVIRYITNALSHLSCLGTDAKLTCCPFRPVGLYSRASLKAWSSWAKVMEFPLEQRYDWKLFSYG